MLAGYAGQGLFRSADDGETWVRIAAGFNPESSITDIVFDPAVPGTVFASDIHSGVYVSEDSGLTWRAVVGGLRTRAVNGLAISSDGAHLYAATEGEGVYRLDLQASAPRAAEPLWVLQEEPAPATTTSTAEPQEPSETTAAPEPTETTVAAAEAGDGDSDPPWPLIGLGAGGAVLAGLAALVVRRRRA